ncbi:MAG: hypothetical protein LH616_14300 [Ilumatobacteraceae bacterium]|nr:hypothetical protein [Ilumatobacteraceae bacterium]
MSVFPRLRLLFARRPWLYWLIVGTCAMAVWLSVASAQAQVTRERDNWGTARRVWVASGPVVAGEVVLAAAVDYPTAILPPSAVSSLPADAVAARSIAAGEVVVAADVAVDGLVPADWVVFAVPADGAPALIAGDAVTVFGSGQAWCDGLAATVNEATVNEVTLEVAVPTDCAASMSAQLALGAITLARHP